MDDDINENGREHFKTLTLDVDYYQSFLEDVDIPEDKKLEFIETMWGIVVQFIDLGIGIHPLQSVKEAGAEDWQKKLAHLLCDSISDAFNGNENDSQKLIKEEL